MWRMIVRRLVVLVPILLLISFLISLLVHFIPGDAAVTLAGDNASEEQVERIRAQLGLDRPLLAQWASWTGNAARGDLGTSLYGGRDVTTSLVERLPASLSLGVGALVVSILIGVPLGVASAIYQGRWPDRVFSLIAASAVAMPGHFLGMLLILAFAIGLGWLPAVGYVAFSQDPVGWMKHLVLPCITLAALPTAVLARQLRASMIEVLSQDYVSMARAKGMRARTVIFKHALKNAAIPSVTVIGSGIPLLVGGAVIVERVFGVPGIGALAVEGFLGRDLPLIQGVVMMAALMVLVSSLLVDLSYSYLNPKVRVR